MSHEWGCARTGRAQHHPRFPRPANRGKGGSKGFCGCRPDRRPPTIFMSAKFKFQQLDFGDGVSDANGETKKTHCENHVCNLPTADPKVAERLLDSRK